MVSVPDVGFRATVPELLRAGCERFGDDDFVVMKDRRLSFRQADELSAVLAKRLLAAGVGKGSRVGILLPSSTQFVIAFLAAARVGAVSALFSTLFRPAELQKALRLADIDVLIAPERLLGREYVGQLEEAVPGLESAVAPLRLPVVPFLREVWLDDDGAEDGAVQRKWATRVSVHPSGSDGEVGQDPGDVTDELLSAVEDQVFPADPLLMIWTSGSAADPKGIVHTHGVAVRKVSPEVGLGLPSSLPGRVLILGPFFWVVGPQSILGALYSGSAMVCMERFDVVDTIELIERERVTFISGWPTMVEQLRSHPDWSRRDTSSLTGIMATAVSSRGNPRNMGMTETFGRHCDRRFFDYKIVDPESGAVLPDGEEGEFYVRGFGLMAGMYKKEREEVFEVDGFYRTGDRGYIEDGEVYFTGRYSEMIKAAGANVSPVEVEGVLMAMPELRLAAVFGVLSEARGEEVVAVVVPVDGCSVDAGSVRDYCRKQLSSYKVPTQIQVRTIDEIPLLPSGKVDKRTLKAGYAPAAN